MKTRLAELNHSHIPEVVAIETTAHVTPWTEKIIQQSFGPRSHNVGLFEVERGQYQLIGYYFSDHIAGEVSLENICISESYQGRGLSKILMTNLIEYSKSINATEIWLEVRASNASAIALYEAYGFVQEGVRAKYYSIPDSALKEDALMMKIAL